MAGSYLFRMLLALFSSWDYDRDLVAAKKAGFMTVWVQYEEMIPLEDLYGQFDIVASDLEDAAKQICQHSYSSL